MRLRKCIAVAVRDRALNGLVQHLQRLLFIARIHLKPDAANEIRYLPIEPHKILISQKNANSGCLKQGSRDNRLRQITVAANRDEVP